MSYSHHQFQAPQPHPSTSGTNNTSSNSNSSSYIDSPHIHCTPPRSSVRKIKNPFERTLVDSLNKPICSPGMFRIRESSGSFKWDIEQVSILKPADIVACNSQFHASPDAELEKKASEAISKFFAQESIVPSPLDVEPKRTALKVKESLNEISTHNSNLCNASTQTTLTFPAILPPEIEEILKPYYSFKMEQNTYDADISANASLRRKLRFEEICSDDEENDKSVHCTEEFILRGVKRSLSSSHSSTSPSLDANMENQSISPVLSYQHQQSRYQSDEILHHTKSPSLSPIKPTNADVLSNTMASIDTSPKTTMHSSNMSSFSQSTPEKSYISSLEIDSSPDSFEITKTKLYQVNKSHSKLLNRSHSETSLMNLKKNLSVFQHDNNMDISGDISLRCSKEHSERGSSDSLLLPTRTLNNLDMEFIETDLSAVGTSVTSGSHSSELDNRNLLLKYNICDEKRAISSENYETFSEVYQLLTPIKNSRKDLTNVINYSAHKNFCRKSISSPMQMSLDNSFNLDSDKYDAKDSVFSNNHAINSVSEESKLNIHSNLNSETFYRMDSGFMESLSKSTSVNEYKNFENSTKCNSSKYLSFTDATKSMQHSCNSSSWKRFDSGFHDETSSDFIHQNNSGDSLKSCLKKHNIISEHLELEDHKEEVDFEDFNKFLEYGSKVHSSMSVTENLDEVVPSVKYNYSSTPSKSQYANL